MITLSELVKSVLDNYNKYASDDNITYLSQLAEQNPDLFLSDYLGIFYSLSNPEYVKRASDEYLTDLGKTFAEYNLALDELHERNPKLAADITDAAINITDNVSTQDYLQIIKEVLAQYSILAEMGESLAEKFCEYLENIGFSDISYKQILEYFSRLIFGVSVELFSVPLMIFLSGVHEKFESEVGTERIDDPQIDEMIKDYKDAIIETIQKISLPDEE